MSQNTHVPRNEAVIEARGNAFSRVWFTFFQTIARKFEGLETITAATPSITSADAATQGGSYNQANVQSIATLANELKVDFNALAAKVTAIETALKRQ